MTRILCTISAILTALCMSPDALAQTCNGRTTYGVAGLNPGPTPATTSGSVGSSDGDYYSFPATQGVSYTFCFGENGGSSSYDPWLCVLSPSYGLIVQNDDTHGLQSHVSFTADTTGTHYVAVSGYSSSSGSYTLAYWSGSSSSSSSSPSSGSLSCNGRTLYGVAGLNPGSTPATTSGSVGSSDGDYYSFPATQGVSYTFCFGENGGSSSYDPWLCVLSPSYGLIVQNDDTHGLQSHVSFTADTTGTHYVAVSGYSSSSGSYTLAYWSGSSSSSSSSPSSGSLSCNGRTLYGVAGLNPGSTPATTSGSVGSSDGDYYSFPATQGVSYTFCFGENGGSSSYDPWLCVLSPSYGLIVQNDDTHGLQSHVSFTADTTGTHYVAVSGYSSSSGSYTLAYWATGLSVPDAVSEQTLSDGTIRRDVTVTINPTDDIDQRLAPWLNWTSDANQSVRLHLNVNMAAGTYDTDGLVIMRPDVPSPTQPQGTASWRPAWKHVRITGAGQGSTTLRLLDTDPFDLTNHNFEYVIKSQGYLDEFTISNLTLDGNWNAQPLLLQPTLNNATSRNTAQHYYKIGGISVKCLRGSATQVEIMNIGANDELSDSVANGISATGIETFGLALLTFSSPSELGSAGTGVTIRNCTVRDLIAVGGGYCTGINVVNSFEDLTWDDWELHTKLNPDRFPQMNPFDLSTYEGPSSNSREEARLTGWARGLLVDQYNPFLSASRPGVLHFGRRYWDQVNWTAASDGWIAPLALVEGNVCRNLRGNALGAAWAEDVVFRNNEVYDCRTGFNFDTGVAHGIVFVGNRFDGVRKGIHISGGEGQGYSHVTDVIVRGNAFVLKDLQPVPPSPHADIYAVHFAGGAFNTRRWSGMVFKDPEYPILTDLATQPYERANVIVEQNTLTLFGAVPSYRAFVDQATAPVAGTQGPGGIPTLDSWDFFVQSDFR